MLAFHLGSGVLLDQMQQFDHLLAAIPDPTIQPLPSLSINSGLRFELHGSTMVAQRDLAVQHLGELLRLRYEGGYHFNDGISRRSVSWLTLRDERPLQTNSPVIAGYAEALGGCTTPTKMKAFVISPAHRELVYQTKGSLHRYRLPGLAYLLSSEATPQSVRLSIQFCNLPPGELEAAERTMKYRPDNDYSVEDSVLYLRQRRQEQPTVANIALPPQP